MSQRLHVILAGLVLATLGCRTPGAVEGPPAPLRILVLDWRATDPPVHEVLVGFSEALVVELGDDGYAAAVDVRRPGSEGPTSLDYEMADVILQPVCPQAPVITNTIDKAAWGSGILWFTTWIFGLCVPDCQYSFGDGFTVNFEVSPGGNPDMPFLAHAIDPGTVELTFFERNEVLSWQFPVSILWPPFLLPDAKQKRVDPLRHRLQVSVAHKLTQFLKIDFEGEALKQGAGSMHLTARPTTDGFEIAGIVRSRRARIDEVVVVVNGVPLAIVTGPPDDDFVANEVQPIIYDDARLHGDVSRIAPNKRSRDDVGTRSLEFELRVRIDEIPDQVVIRARSDQSFSRTLQIAD